VGIGANVRPSKTTINKEIRMGKCIPVLMVCMVSLAAGGAATADAPQNIAGKTVECPAARSQPCDADSCAYPCELVLRLPVGATYVGTHYFTSADSPNDRGAPYETGLKELPKARFAQAVHALNQNHEDVVTVYFYNRADHTRKVAISVDYTAR
jgi:hypothetical protein